MSGMAVDLVKGTDPSSLRSGRRSRLRLAVPNGVTFASILCGLFSVHSTLQGEIESAAALIFAAAVLDALDGRLARLLNATSRFGAELDSLADFLCFGVAPAVLLFAVLLAPLGDLGWLVAASFAAGIAFRLARFNKESQITRSPEPPADFFVGLPAPAAAILVLTPVCFHLATDARFPAEIIALHLLVTTALSISRLPVYSAKGAKWLTPRLAALLGAPFIAGLLLSPWQTLTALGVAGALSMPLHLVLFEHLRRRPPVRQSESE